MFFLFATNHLSFTILVQNIVIAYKVHRLLLWLSWLLHYNFLFKKKKIYYW